MVLGRRTAASVPRENSELPRRRRQRFWHSTEDRPGGIVVERPRTSLDRSTALPTRLRLLRGRAPTSA